MHELTPIQSKLIELIDQRVERCLNTDRGILSLHERLNKTGLSIATVHTRYIVQDLLPAARERCFLVDPKGMIEKVNPDEAEARQLFNITLK